MAMPQVAWEMASTVFLILNSEEWNRLSKRILSSVASAMRDMVCTVSTGYLPAAVSPESMTALVPS